MVNLVGNVKSLNHKRIVRVYFETFVLNFITTEVAAEIYNRLLKRNKKQWPEMTCREEILFGIMSEVDELAGKCPKYLAFLHRTYSISVIQIDLSEYCNLDCNINVSREYMRTELV